jgi:tetratricopeptide (TPR) repeat protein
MIKHLRFISFFIVVPFLAAQSLYGQGGQSSSGASDPGLFGSILVSVRTASGIAPDSFVEVSLYTVQGQLHSSQTLSVSNVRFEAIPVGHYVVKATAPGYLEASEAAELEGRFPQVSVALVLRPVPDPNAKPVASGPPLLAPKVQKELHAGLEALRAGKLDEARKQLTAAGQQAPNHPEVNYLLGLLSQRTGDPDRAKTYWEKGLSQWPHHLFSLLAMADLLLSQGDLTASKTYVDRAFAADAFSGRAHFLCARINLQAGVFEDAAKEAKQAIELDKEDALAARLILAKSQVGLHQRDEAVATLEALLKAGPSDSLAASARRILDALSTSAAEGVSAQTQTEANLTLADPSKSTAAPLLPPPAKWIPADIDEKIPPVQTGVPCPLDKVLSNAGKRVVEFTKAVDHFSATELLEHQVIDPRGIAVSSENRRFNYLVSIQEVRPGYLNVDEYRDGSLGYDMFPGGLATVGLPSIILMFHPVNVADYDMTCEGLGNWQGTPAWQVHFRHRDVTRSPIRTYKIGGHVYPIPLRGRAWISASNSQVLRIETDLRDPVPEIKLLAEHQSLDYGPVKFKDRDVQLWLPADTDIYFNYKGRRVHRRHSFSDFLLFSVEDKQKIGKPKEAETPAPAAGAVNPSS